MRSANLKVKFAENPTSPRIFLLLKVMTSIGHIKSLVEIATIIAAMVRRAASNLKVSPRRTLGKYNPNRHPTRDDSRLPIGLGRLVASHNQKPPRR